MKKTLLILCALLLTSIGATADDESYKFVNTDWVGVDYRSADEDQVTYGTDGSNTITVTATGANNIALQNLISSDTYSTAGYTVSGWQHWFIVVGTNLSTTASDSKLWWMNGANNGGEWEPTKVVTLTDKVLVAWDLSLMPAIDMNLHNDENYLNGWICFGLTSTDATTHTSVISDIGFYTLEEAIAAYSELEGVLEETTKPYEFKAENWVALSDHAGTNVTTTEDNTIKVTYSTGNEAGLGNGNDSYNTAGYYVTEDQKWFVIQGTGLSTSGHLLWWMNGYNDAGEYAPTEVVTLEDGSVVLAWDLSKGLGNYMLGKKNTLNGLTCFGLIADNPTTGFTITDINFYTETEAYNLLNGTDATHVCEANINHWTFTLTDDGGTLGGYWVDSSEKNDGSGMEPPFLTYWISEGEGSTYLPNTQITHDELTGLAAGVYEVSLDIRIIDYDEGTVGEGTTFNATSGSNTASQDIKLGVDAHEISFNDSGAHDDIYGTYTLYVTVAEGGSLTVSLDIKDATYNWIMFKNLKVRLLGESEEIPSGTVSGTMGADYGTLILPFDATITDDTAKDITAYTGTLNEDKDELTLTAVDGDLKAGTPYIIGGSENTTYKFQGVPTKYEVSYSDGLLTGTLVNMTQDDFTADGTEYVLQIHEEEGDTEPAFYPITSDSEGVTLSAYHCYLTLDSGTSGSGVRAFISLPGSDEATRIVAVESEEAEGNGAIYDLSGRKVSKAVKGVYIQNGKKVLVK